MSEMTLSQALRHAKKLKGQLAEVTGRAKAGVSYKDSQKPAFEFKASMEKASALRKDLLEMTTRIRVTNAVTTLEFGGRTIHMSEAVAKLEDLKGEIAWVKELPVKAQASVEESEYDYNDAGQRVMVKTRWTCELPEAQRADVVEKLQEEFDRLNDAVERVNHVTPLKAVA